MTEPDVPSAFVIRDVRLARPTTRLTEIVAFYRDDLGFALIGGFDDHAGFDGVMLGRPDLAFHLEFVHERGTPPEPPPSPEDLLALYLDVDAWTALHDRLTKAGVAFVEAHNPYWDVHGRTIADPDGRRIVLHRGPWRA